MTGTVRQQRRERAATPPMGWNSWDCFGASVTEDEVIANAEFMAAHLLPFGWDTVVVDIQWYEPDPGASTSGVSAARDRRRRRPATIAPTCAST